MKTKWLVEEDVLACAARLHKEISDELVQTILEEYDNYRTQYPTELWVEIIGIMIDDFTGPQITYTP